MFTILRTTGLFLSCIIFISTAFAANTALAGRDLLVLENESAYFAIDLGGGTITDFHLKDQGLNPFTWNHPDPVDTAPRPQGHFICFDRWGAPTKAEQKNGMPFHGEASTSTWKVEKKPSPQDGKIVAVVSCHLPIAQLRMERTISLDDKSAVIEISETITNTGKLGRMYNLIQHGSFAAPFLSKDTLIDTDVARGFIQNGPKPGEPVIYWPHIAYNGQLVDLRKLDTIQGPGVMSFVFPDDYTTGWITACNPTKGLLVGYTWDLNDYPWLNMWRNFNADGPAAFGIEFGTSGLHQPYPVLVKQHTVFDRQLYEFIDAGETNEKAYTLFLKEIPSDYTGTGELSEANGTLNVKEIDGGSGHTFTINVR